MFTHTTSDLSPVASSSDPRSLFYSGFGVLVRVVTAGKLSNKWLYRPISIIKPGSRRVVSYSYFNEFERGPDRVVTILKPSELLTLLWGFKQDVGSDNKGEPNVHFATKPGACKKITDLSMLMEKLVEQKHREASIFLPFTSGHIRHNGFRLHKNKPESSYQSLNVYPEMICRLNPLQAHAGYLFDPKREASFQRIAETMASILAMEKANGNGNFDGLEEPVTLSLYDSYRGRFLAPEELNLSMVEKIEANANALSQYERSMGMEGKLYGLLAQSGCKRFLSLLKEIPENVRALAEAGTIIPLDELERAIIRLEAGKFHDLLSSLGETLLNQIGLPEYLLNLLLKINVISQEDVLATTQTEQFILQYIGNDRLERLLTDAFPEQAEICRTLLKHGLYFPVIPSCHWFSSTNPLVTCLLIAQGSRAKHGLEWKMHIRGVPTLLYNANEFLNAGLLTEEEAKRVRHSVLLDALCFGDRGCPLASDEIKMRFQSLVRDLGVFLGEVPAVSENPPTLASHQAKKTCHELLGNEIWDIFSNHDSDGAKLKLLLESDLPPQRYSDDELRQHLEWLECAGAMSTPYTTECMVHHLGTYHEVLNRAVTKTAADKGKHTDWLTALLATPPAFDRCEFARVGRYRAITQTVGQHYYQYHHPNSAPNITTNSAEYVHRRYHGIDHALRTQMATEFLIEILPSYHKPFRQLLDTYPALPELLKIAEFYHDAVAEDEPKNTEESRASELFERDMQALDEYPDELITLVATALKNKNSNEMSPVQTPFSADDQCSGEELLLRQVLRFGDVVDILRLLPLQEDFLEVKDNFVTDPVSAHREPDKFDPQAIELLAVVNNPMFTRKIKAALLTFRDLAALTGGWHHESENPAAVRHQLRVDNQQRRLLVEHSHDPYTQMRVVLDDLVRLEIAKRADISTCLDQDGHRDYVNNGSAPGCWDKMRGAAGAYHKLHSEVELRQVQVPEEMTLSEKVRFIAESELPDADRLALSSTISSRIDGEINRLRQEGIQPATGTPSQDELQQIYERPDSIGASILTNRDIIVEQAEHEGRTYFRMIKLKPGAESSLST